MKKETAEDIILGIDYPLLKEQKKAMLKLIEDIDDVPLLEKIEGIIVLIDSIQDCAVDTYGKDENEVFDLHDDEEDKPTLVLGKPEVVQGFMTELMENWNKAIYAMPEDEKPVPENFSDVEVLNFKVRWGQMHNEVCRELGYPLPHVASDELLMVDYFWIEKDRMWYPKNSSLYTEREEAIAKYLRA